MSTKKTRKISRQNLTAPTVSAILTDGNEMHGDNPGSIVPCCENLANRQDTCMPGKPNGCQSIRRKSKRLRANGIVALTCFEKLVVSSIYDIAEGGVSFLQANENEISKSEFEMDILIYDSLTGFEYSISHIMGRVKWKSLVFGSEIHEPIWRFNIEFIDLDSLQRKKLQWLCSQEQQQMFGLSTIVYQKYHMLHEKHETCGPLEGRISRQPK